MCVRLLDAKSNWNVLDQRLEFFAKMMLDATHVKENMPTGYYDAKRMVSKLGLEVKRLIVELETCLRKTGKLHGMKSHDCHVFMKQLLPVAFSSLPKHVLNPLTEISQFFKDIFASTLRVDEIIKLDQNIVVILYKLEQIFSPGFFDSMEPLPVNFAYEAYLGGTVQYR
ncbi:hypothetical protein KIW84_072082 [Lathyrus oleraceus]|uniref:DUF4218 domain-containing protein n=1 Tax=Pisum sativum TaxID=3888 RepID=A0A9D4VMH2_PEA|nr:hypothetical protein KIW84_072082 [Pisum sativum]